MSRPTARLCADCLPAVLRPRGGGGPLLLPAAPAPRRVTPRRVRIAESRRGLHGVQERRSLGYARGQGVRPCGNVKMLAGSCQHMRQFATAGEKDGAEGENDSNNKSVPQEGPLKEYEDRISQGRLRNDPHQRRMCSGSDSIEQTTTDSCLAYPRYYSKPPEPLRDVKAVQSAECYSSYR